jgi:Helix-turn-helix domain
VPWMAGQPGGSGPTLLSTTAPPKVLAYTLEQVAEMLQEPATTIAKHCRTQALRGAYKTGGKTSPWRIPPKAIEHYQNSRNRY